MKKLIFAWVFEGHFQDPRDCSKIGRVNLDSTGTESAFTKMTWHRWLALFSSVLLVLLLLSSRYFFCCSCHWCCCFCFCVHCTFTFNVVHMFVLHIAFALHSIFAFAFGVVFHDVTVCFCYCCSYVIIRFNIFAIVCGAAFHVDLTSDCVVCFWLWCYFCYCYCCYDLIL